MRFRRTSSSPARWGPPTTSRPLLGRRRGRRSLLRTGPSWRRRRPGRRRSSTPTSTSAGSPRNSRPSTSPVTTTVRTSSSCESTRRPGSRWHGVGTGSASPACPRSLRTPNRPVPFASPPSKMAFRISVDTGGTFTDVVVDDERGHLRIGKALTSRARAYDGIRQGLAQIAPELGLSVEELLSQTEVFTYGTTRSTNAIVEGTTARTAFFTTEGFPDILLLREGGKLDPFKQIPYPPPYVPRYLTFEIAERMDSEGTAFVALDEGSALRAIEEARALRAEAVAVSFLWSIANPAHELRVGELLDEHWPGLPYTLSHRLNPIIREYRRASSTAIDASLKPVIQDYL